MTVHDGHGHSHYDTPASRRPRSEMERWRSKRPWSSRASWRPTSSMRTSTTLEHRIGPHHGARVVAEAWRDPIFKERLLDDGTAAIAELGIAGPEGNVRVVENTPAVHNLVVCTLCSCYPWPLLGLPPIWYKSFAYRSRAVAEPRAVLREFGVHLDHHIEIMVWDSSAEVRYLVLPQRPAGTEDLDDEALAALVTRDSMIGTALVHAP